MSEIKVPMRSDIPLNILERTQCIPTISDWELEVEKSQVIWKPYGKLQGSLKTIHPPYRCAPAARCIGKRVNKVDMYAHISYQVAKTTRKLPVMVGQTKALLGQSLAAASFIEPEILEIGWQTIQKWVAIRVTITNIFSLLRQSV